MSKELEALDCMYLNEFNDMTEEYALIKKALLPPTVGEVCALIEKDIKGGATYSCGHFYINNEKVDDILFGVFSAKTLIAIGKFYESLYESLKEKSND